MESTMGATAITEFDTTTFSIITSTAFSDPSSPPVTTNPVSTVTVTNTQSITAYVISHIISPTTVTVMATPATPSPPSLSTSIPSYQYHTKKAV